MKRRSTLMLLAAAMLAAPVAAQDDATLDVVGPFEIKGPEPSTSGYFFTQMGIAETLVDADPEGLLVPGLATGWEASADGLSWRFALRDGVRFHDGTAMTAETVVNALQIARAKPGLFDAFPIELIRAETDDVIVELAEPLAALPAFLAEARTQILAPDSYGPDGQGRQILGTGPYRLTLLEPPLRLEAEAFDDYWGEAPSVDRVSYTAVSRVETRALMAESGEAEFVYGLDPASVTRLGQLDSVDVQSVAMPRTLLIKVNAGHRFLDAPEARRALSLAIDREGIARGVLRYPEGANQLFPPSVAAWHDDALEPLGHDPDAARALLAELGWTPGADGILERDGERFALTLLTYPDRPELPLVAAVLEQQFREIGIAITIDTTSFSEIPARHQNGSLELALLARNFALLPDPIGTVMQDYAPNGDWGSMGWENPEFVDLVRTVARGEGNEDGAAERARAVALLQEDLPVIPIVWYRQTASVADTVKGAVIDPWERTFGLPAVRWSQ